MKRSRKFLFLVFPMNIGENPFRAAVVLRPDSKLTPEEIENLCRGKDRRLQDTEKRYMYGMNCRKNTTGKVCKAQVLKKIKEEN